MIIYDVLWWFMVVTACYGDPHVSMPQKWTDEQPGIGSQPPGVPVYLWPTYVVSWVKPSTNQVKGVGEHPTSSTGH